MKSHAAIRTELKRYSGNDPDLKAAIKWFLGLSAQEQEPVLEGINTLSHRIKNLGVISAFEVLLKLGRNLARQQP